MKFLSALFVIVILISGVARADYYDGLRAYDAKDYQHAYYAWRLSSLYDNDERSQYRLGKLYEDGLGVPQDLIEAYLNYHLAASQGNEDALRARNALAVKMDTVELSKAREQAVHQELKGGTWVLKGYGAQGNVRTPCFKASVTFLSRSYWRGDTGCNKFQGGYELSGKNIKTEGMSTTERWCEDALHREQEAFVLSTLAGEMDVENNQLVLRKENRVLVFAKDAASSGETAKGVSYPIKQRSCP